MVGVFGDHIAQTETVSKFGFGWLEVQHDARTALGLFNRGDAELTFTR